MIMTLQYNKNINCFFFFSCFSGNCNQMHYFPPFCFVFLKKEKGRLQQKSPLGPVLEFTEGEPVAKLLIKHNDFILFYWSTLSEFRKRTDHMVQKICSWWQDFILFLLITLWTGKITFSVSSVRLSSLLSCGQTSLLSLVFWKCFGCLLLYLAQIMRYYSPLESFAFLYCLDEF